MTIQEKFNQHLKTDKSDKKITYKYTIKYINELKDKIKEYKAEEIINSKTEYQEIKQKLKKHNRNKWISVICFIFAYHFIPDVLISNGILSVESMAKLGVIFFLLILPIILCITEEIEDKYKSEINYAVMKESYTFVYSDELQQYIKEVDELEAQLKEIIKNS